MRNLVLTMADVAGSVDLLAVVDPRQPAPDPIPADLPIDRFEVVARPASVVGPRARLRSLSGVEPARLAGRDTAPVAASVRAMGVDRPVLAFGFDLAAVVEPLGASSFIVDINDLEDAKILARLEGAGGRGPGAAVRKALGVRDAAAWRRLQQRVAGSADLVLACSAIDAERLGAGRRVVVANGYDRPAAPVGASQVGEPPTVMFCGSFSYPPNVDGARFLVADVLPRLRTLVPGVEVRLVGTAGPEVQALAAAPGVTVTGFVDDVVDELARADVVVVPLRFGSGTRIKVLEAFAHRIPVVSTTMGAEGIEVVDGEHALLADDADGLAAACARALTDVALRDRLAEAGGRLFAERYDWEVIRRGAARAIGEVVGQPRPAGREQG